jgi:transglutaminase-like putative cysteine protease
VLIGFARSHFGALDSPIEQVRAICEYVWRHVGYEPGISGPASDAIETLLVGRGVCRDFAHLLVKVCRAVDVPARMAAIYALGLPPMDSMPWWRRPSTAPGEPVTQPDSQKKALRTLEESHQDC